MCYSLVMTNTESAKRTHMVAYTWSGPGGFGPGAIDMTLPGGFADPEVRTAIERLIIDTTPHITSVVIMNVIPYAPSATADLAPHREALTNLAGSLRETFTLSGETARYARIRDTADALDMIAGEL